MDNNLILILVVGIAISVMLWRSVFGTPWKFNIGWIVVSLLVGGVMGALWLVEAWRDFAGIVGLGLWVLLVIFPAWMMRLTMQYTLNGRYAAALKTMRIAAFLHPADTYPQQASLIRAYQLEAMGDNEGAAHSLEPLLEHPRMRYLVAHQYFRIQNRSADFLTWIETETSPGAFQKNPTLLDGYLRTLASTGDLNTLVTTFTQYKRVMERANNLLGTQLLTICAYTGREDAVKSLFNGPFVGFNDSMKQVWLAITDFAAGHTDEGQAKLDAVLALEDKPESQAGHSGLALQSARRIQQNGPVIAAEVLTPESAALADQIAATVMSAVQTMPKPTRPIITLLLIVANVLVFVLVVQQGGEQVARALFEMGSQRDAARAVATLYELGALYPPSVLEAGEWWRVFNAIFLHIGIMHLGLNMLGLYVIGSGVEQRLGWLRYLIVYFAAGLGSTLVILWLTSIGAIEVGVYLGASGAIMGMVGAMGGSSLVDWWRRRSRAALRGLRSALIIMALQTVLDLIVPQVSLEGHLSGAVIGFFVTLILLAVFSRPKRKAKAS